MKCYRSKGGGILPVEMKDGNLVVWDLTCMKPLKNNISVVQPWGTEENFYNNACTESPAQTLEEMRIWKRNIDDAMARKRQAEMDLAQAEHDLEKLEHRVKDFSYAETKAMGCTYQLEWDNEYVTNPKTGNEFWTEEDAKAKYWELNEQNKEKIEREREEWGGDDDPDNPISFDDYFRNGNDFVDASDYLDDLIEEEEQGVFDSYGDDDYWLRRSPEYKRFKDKRNSGFLTAVLNFYLAGSGNPHVEHFEIKTRGYHNGQPKEFTLTGGGNDRISIERIGKKK